MDSNEEHQNLEIQALKSIYHDVFFESAPPKAWKGAARLPEFNIKIVHPLSPSIYFLLNVKYPKAYPLKSPPILSITQYNGLAPTQVTKIMNLVHAEAQRCIGGEAIFSIILYMEEWFKTNILAPKEPSGLSLAIEMQNRELEEEKAMKKKEESLAKAEGEREARRAEELLQQIEQDAQRKEEIQRQEKERHRARRRALSDATEKPMVETSIETFDKEIEAFGVRFDSVRLYHGRHECLGITYSAEPVCDDPDISMALELHVVVIEASYYKTQPGKKKMDQVANELTRLTGINDDLVLRVFLAQLTVSKSDESSRLIILMEKRPSLTLYHLLQDCDGLREDRVSQYMSQICSGLSKIHEAGLVHRAMNPSSIGLVESSSGIKTVKLMRVAFYTKLHDFHNSEPFGPNLQADAQEPPLPDNWLWREAIESPLLYTRCRDMHAVGVIALQMLMGLDVVQRYPNPRTAMQDVNATRMAPIISDCLKLGKKGIPDAVDVLGKLARESLHLPARPRPISVKSNSTLMNDVKTPKARPPYPTGSPETSYFVAPESRSRRASRWREDWEELDTLGKGGFGSVVKARNRLDGRDYAIKKIKLRTAQGDNKIFREVNALSRLSHRFIVRYYTTWLEESEPTSSNVSSDSEQDADDLDDKTAGVQLTRTLSQSQDGSSFADPRSVDINDLVLEDNAKSFPSIRFTSGDVASDGSDEEEASSLRIAEQLKKQKFGAFTPPPMTLRTLYIQMEYVERQTLRERIAEGISEDEAWRLFQQVVDALVHMASLGILHRDIKLTNIFIDSHGDCKVGDFGLATSSLAAVDPSDVSPMSVAPFSDMTLDVGTRLYIAPEILSRRGGSRSRDHSKADLYSLGVVFFEMNYMFSTASERIFVIENLRLPEVCFPSDWDVKRSAQREIIQSLLQHDPDKRPTAIQLSQSPLLPSRMEDEYFKEALQAMTKSRNQFYPAVLASLFSQEPNLVRGHIYDEDMPESSSLRHVVIEHLDRLFRLHGARDVDVPLLMPLTKVHLEDQRQVLLVDTHGEIITLPSNALVPFARLAARTGTTRIKRYHVGDTYRGGNLLGHPVVSTAAIFDIITPDTVHGLEVGSAEMITLMDECLGMFPNLANNYQVHVSHSKISEIVMARIPEKLRATVVDVLQTKASSSQKRASLQKRGLSKGLIDELEWLYEDYEDVSMPLMRLEKYSSPLAGPLSPLLREIGKVVGLVLSSGMSGTVRIKPLMVGRRHDFFKNGICFEVVGIDKRAGILAVGGRYDHLISELSPPSTTRDYHLFAKKEPFVAVGLQIALERITSAIASFQCDFITNLNNQRTYDFWSARRCDVYIVSFQPGQLSVRLEVAAMLWRHGISADLMYETGVSDTNMEGLANLCYNEGILFTLYPKLKSGQQEATDFRIKSVLRGTESEVSKLDLIPWLQHQIAEQKKNDLASSGVTGLSSEISSSSITSIKENNNSLDVQLILPGEGTNLKKQRKATKQLFLDRAYEKRMRLKSTMQSGSLPMLAIDVPPGVFDALMRSDAWVTDDDTWRTIASGFPTQHMVYANQIRDNVARRKIDGADYMILFAVREERMALLSFRGCVSDR
ncbi:kinase-like domain-containing protein [Phellopilus nigrolimitatus]|nr:kinase-like domain-containing protein [Phellopilus nigrolimitatus]